MLAAAVLGCEPGTVTLVGLGQSDGTVVRDTVRIHVAVDPADAALADSLGWQAGVPNAEIRLLRKGEGEWVSAFTDSTGIVAFDRLLPGTYRLYAQRVLSPEEADLAGGTVRAFGDGRTVDVSRSQTIDLRLAADRPGSLVISEIGVGTPPPWETSASSLPALYFEVYNNADTVLYLDGVLFTANPFVYEYSVPLPCPVTAPVRTDSTGVYVGHAVAFPGSGTDYPIGPGEVRTVAYTAIDHTQLHPSLNDLSNADFEIGLAGVANNPGVPDMRDVGLGIFIPGYLLATRNVYALALPQDLAGLSIEFRDSRGRGYVRIPRALLLDVAVIRSLWPLSDGEFPWCVPMVAPALNRYEGGFVNIGFDSDQAFRATRSLQRPFLRRDPSGRVILMNTHTSAVDFVHVLKTPGSVPTDSVP